MISSNPTSAELVQYQTWLTEAEAAMHKLLTGSSAASLSYNGESVTWRAADMPRLRAYIADLRRALGKSSLANPGVTFKPVVFNAARGGSGALY